MIDPNATTLPPELPPSHEESTDSLLREVAATPAVSPVAAYTLRPGVVLAGRYRIESLLGRGGMGTVFRALDTRLGRPVAIKVHHGRASALERLRQEARALAQLSHPNVVTVLEVGSVDGSPFVVMEFVDGANARQWRDAGERSWQEIVALYREAGLGLAAAHRVGLVHRDFKPDNVLVGHDGRPRVADFGLANLRGITVADDAHAPTAGDAATLTHHGAFVGTPAYVAPEQILDSRVDARADQFSFCASLFEAIYDELPFPAQNPRAMIDRILVGDLVRPVSPTRAPRWLADVLARGLSRRPDERFADMDALLAALRGPRRRPRWLLAAGMAAVTAAIAAVAVPRDERDPRCEEDPLAALDPARRDVTAWVEASGDADLAQGWQRASTAIGSHAERWREAFAIACESAAPRRSPGFDAQLRRLDCLDGDRVQVESLLAELRPGEGAALLAMIDEVVNLSDPMSCVTVDDTAAGTAPTEELRGEAKAIEASIAVVQARIAAGARAAALSLADELVARANALGDEGLLAQAFLLRGRARLVGGVHVDGEADVLDAVRIAERISRPRVVLEGSLLLALAAINARDDLRTAERWLETGRGAVRRWPQDADVAAAIIAHEAFVRASLGDQAAADRLIEEASRMVAAADLGPDAEVLLEEQQARVWSFRNDLGRALEHAQRGLALAREAYGPVHIRVGTMQLSICGIYDTAGNYLEARTACRGAVETLRRTTEPRDRYLLTATSALASLESIVGNPTAALELYDGLREVMARETTDPAFEQHISSSRGLTLLDLERYDEAYAELSRALALNAQLAPDLGNDGRGELLNLALIERIRGRVDEAAVLLQRARKLQDALGREDAKGADLLLAEGELAILQGRLDEAEARLVAAVAGYETLYAADDPVQGWPQLALGRVELQRRRPDRALPHLERAAAAFASDQISVGDRAEVGRLHAEALWQGGDRSRARAVAQAALAELEALPQPLVPAFARRRSDLQAWLRERPESAR
ncbi:MAG: serine/threonine-protein kinase [Nannocystaceae bacterium]|nr:serine/threonine-protein kinase [Nannocystaceae bacterium]